MRSARDIRSRLPERAAFHVKRRYVALRHCWNYVVTSEKRIGVRIMRKKKENMSPVLSRVDLYARRVGDNVARITRVNLQRRR